MNKLMLSAAAVALTFAMTPAFAADDAGVKLSLGGFFKGYVNYTNEDNVHSLDILRSTEVHFAGETTLDNGLTVDAMIEAKTDGGDSFDVDESYIYMAGSWGRTNLGVEDGAAYLLQVAAPSADANIDGVRQSISPTTFGGVDYANDVTRGADKLTYLSPVFSGFQAGVSYTPNVDGVTALLSGGTASRGATGNSADNQDNHFDSVYEAAARYEGQISNVGVILGAGYTHASLQLDPSTVFTDDFSQWNVGADFDIGAFGIGAVYTENNTAGALGNTEDEETFTVGGDYTTGPFKIGASYLNDQIDSAYDEDRYTAGVIYTYGPGMTFRGSVGYTELDIDGTSIGDADATTVSLGTQVNF